jgi:hypothetical protein
VREGISRLPEGNFRTNVSLIPISILLVEKVTEHSGKYKTENTLTKIITSTLQHTQPPESIDLIIATMANNSPRAMRASKKKEKEGDMEELLRMEREKKQLRETKKKQQDLDKKLQEEEAKMQCQAEE